MDLNAHNQLWIIFRCNYYYTFALLAPLLLNHRIYSIILFLAAAFLLLMFLSLSLLDFWIYWYYVRWNTYTPIHIVHLMH